jgi:RNA-directed DNA polymerase
MVPEGDNKGPTLEQVLERENLRTAWRQVKANAGAAGVDGMDIASSRAHLKVHWEAIAAKLRSGDYRPAAVQSATIPKPDGGERMLGIPTVLDRLIQQAIHQVLSPLWEVDFSPCSYGYRPGRSAHDAVRQARQYVEAGKHWVVDIDLKSFFDQVDHDKLMGLVGRKVRDKGLLALIARYLKAPRQAADGRRERRTRGTPQGGPLSPLLANIYLDPLDRELTRRGLSFVRYADDVAIHASSQRSAERIYASVVRWIEKHLKVEVNRDKSGSGPSDESGLLGFRLYRDGRVGVAPKAIKKLKARVRALWEARQNRTDEELREQWREYITGWWNYFQLADWRRDVTNLSGWIRRHMRKCFWQRWKTPVGRRRGLRRLGIRGRAEGIGSCSRGAWPMARHVTVQQALSNRWLQGHGYIVPWDAATAPR